MTRLTAVLTLIGAFCFCHLAQTPPEESPKSINYRVDALFAKWNKPDSPGCALAVVKDGTIVYKRGHGMANLENSVPITPKSVFNIESTSKQLGAIAILLLAQQGELSLDDNVRKYLPEVPDFGTPITIRNLIYQTSGLRRFQNRVRGQPQSQPVYEPVDLFVFQKRAA